MLLSGVDYPLQYVASVRSIIVTIQILLVFDLYFLRRRFQAISRLRQPPARLAGRFSKAENTEELAKSSMMMEGIAPCFFRRLDQ
jgi:hypothetical protein